MGYYDRNKPLRLEKYRSRLIQNEAKQTIYADSNISLIDVKLYEARSKGEFVPGVNTVVEYKNRGKKGLGKVIGYDVIRGELRVVCIPEVDIEEKQLGQGLAVVKIKNLRESKKNISNITFR